ncbi:alpha/beta fold hydrolase [Flavobacterium noncentrifugens]|nr:alpha/beta fold hydrolase [Flavobacterium noncentrifugens]
MYVLIMLVFLSVCQQVSAQSRRPTVVIVQGAFGGSWGYRKVDSLLTAKGCNVYRPSLTGLGERVHLSSPGIGLHTHILDVVNTILYEDLHDVVLVGHSYGGMVITGVADSIPERIQKLIYVDAAIPENGESIAMIWGKTDKEMEKSTTNGYQLATWVPAGKLPPKDVPQPIKTFTDTLVLKNRRAQTLPGYFISCGWKEMAGRAANKGWPVFSLGTDHNVQWSDPMSLSQLIFQLATNSQDGSSKPSREK